MCSAAARQETAVASRASAPCGRAQETRRPDAPDSQADTTKRSRVLLSLSSWRCSLHRRRGTRPKRSLKYCRGFGYRARLLRCNECEVLQGIKSHIDTHIMVLFPDPAGREAIGTRISLQFNNVPLPCSHRTRVVPVLNLANASPSRNQEPVERARCCIRLLILTEKSGQRSQAKMRSITSSSAKASA